MTKYGYYMAARISRGDNDYYLTNTPYATKTQADKIANEYRKNWVGYSDKDIIVVKARGSNYWGVYAKITERTVLWRKQK